MICPKCFNEMQEVIYKRITIDRCLNCSGLWFDSMEAERLRNEWMSEFLDAGGVRNGRRYDSIDTANCPRCYKPMLRMYDKQQHHIWYEACPDGEGRFFDSGEFSDWIHNTLLDRVRDLIKGRRLGGIAG